MFPGKTGRRHPLLQDHHPQSGSSSTAGERLTTPCSPPHLLLLLLTPSLPPSTLQGLTIQPTHPPTSLHLTLPGRGPSVFLQRGRKWWRAGVQDAAAVKPRNAQSPRPIRISLSFRNASLPLLHLAPCSPGGDSGRWLRPIEKGRLNHLCRLHRLILLQ